MALDFFCLLEQLGEEYFSRWYVQDMLLYGAVISLYAFIWYFNLRLLSSILF